MNEVVARAPDASMAAVLTYDDEIRFGPAYFRLTVGALEFPGRIFGDSYLWSPDARYFAIQEWLTTDYVRGPHTQLLLVEPQAKRAAAVSTAEKGFIEPLRFDLPLLIYQKRYLAQGVTREFDIDVTELHRWHSIGERRILLPP